MIACGMVWPIVRGPCAKRAFLDKRRRQPARPLGTFPVHLSRGLQPPNHRQCVHLRSLDPDFSAGSCAPCAHAGAFKTVARGCGLNILSPHKSLGTRVAETKTWERRMANQWQALMQRTWWRWECFGSGADSH